MANKCKYYLEIDGHSVVLNGDKELTDYIKSNSSILPTGELGMKFSIYNKDQNETIKALDKASQYDVTIENPYTFVEKKHIIKGKEELLVPVFNDVNYRKDLEEEIIKELNNPTPAVLKNELEKRLEMDSFMKKLSIDLGAIFRARLKAKLNVKTNFNSDLKKVIIDIILFNDKILKTTTNITDDLIQSYSDKILKALDVGVNDLIDLNGVLKVNQNISVNSSIINDTVKMSASVNVLNIDDRGVPHIFELKVSEKRYDEWSSPKKRTTDYILGIKRQLLGNFTDVSKTTLNIINIVIPKESNGVLNLNAISVGQKIERSRAKEISGVENSVDPLNYINGPMTSLLRTLLPSSPVISNTETSTLVKDTKDLIGLVFPKYQIKTKLVLDPEVIIERNIKRARNQKEIYFYDRLQTHNQKVVISKENPEWEKEYREKMTEYITRWNENKDSRMIALKEEIIASKKNRNREWNDRFKGDNGAIERMISKYLDPEWTLLNTSIEGLDELGILLFHNNKNNTLEAIAVTNNNLDTTHNLGAGTSLLGLFKTDSQVHNKKVLSATGANIEAIKVLAALNSLKDSFRGQALAGIEVLNIDPFNDKSQIIFIDQIVDNFGLLLDEAEKRNNNPIKNNFRNQNIKIADKFLNLYQKIMMDPYLTDPSPRSRKAAGIINPFELGNNLPSDDNGKLQWFIKVRSAMMSGGLNLEKDMKGVPDFDDPIQALYVLVSEGINYYKGLINIFDYGTPKFGIGVGDATHFLKVMLFGDAQEYDSKGNKIAGIMQGSQFSTTDALQSKALSNLHNLIAIASNKISETFQKEHSVVNKATESFYNAIGRSDLQRWTIGSADKHHRIFFETNINNEISSDFKFKNPWDPNSNLDHVHRDYLKTILFAIYKNSNLNTKGIKTLSELEASNEFVNIRNGLSDLFYAPLIKSSKSSRWIPTTKEFHKFAGRVWDNIKDDLDPQAKTEEERIKSFKSINEFKKVHNQYDLGEDRTFRENLIEKYGVEHFEVNIDTIATKYILEHIREKYLNSIMLDIHSGITMIKFHGWKTGSVKELIDALDDFWDQLKISVYNTSILEGEGTDAILLVKKAQRVASLMTIALRPMLMAKELLVGLYKNAAFSFYKTYGDESFAEKDLMFGYMKILDPTKDEYILNSSINQVFRIANADLNQLANRKKYDRFGINFISDNFYWFSTAPDYVNRMSLFLAKMHKDGAYNAYSMNDLGELEYDPAKDDRYAYYFANRNKYKVNGVYKFSANDPKYTTQRSLYLSALEEFNFDRTATNEPLLTEEDKITQAYSSKERASIKTFIDTAYGHYDHDTSPLILNKVAGILFGQFLRYYPDKVKYYIGKPNKNSNRGYMGQKYQTEDDGSITLLWKKEEILENGDILISEVPEIELNVNDVRVPAMGWVGEPSEGILYSLAYTAHSLFKGDLDKVRPNRLRMAKLALNDLLASLIFLWLGSLMINDKKEWKDKSNGEKQLTKLGLKSINELNLFASLFGSLQATPAFIGIWGNILGDFKKFLGGDMPISALLKDNIRMLELLPVDPRAGK